MILNDIPLMQPLKAILTASQRVIEGSVMFETAKKAEFTAQPFPLQPERITTPCRLEILGWGTVSIKTIQFCSTLSGAHFHIAI